MRGVFLLDGKDQRGNEFSRGMYFCQLKIKDHAEVKRMLLLK